MASDGPGVISDSPEDHREDRADLKPTSRTDTSSPPAVVPADPHSGKDPQKTPAGKSFCLVLHTLIRSACLLFLQWVSEGH